MRYVLYALLAASCWYTSQAQAMTPTNLQLAGKGNGFYKGVIKVYQAELTVSPQASRQTVLSPDILRCLQLDYAVDLEADKFILAANTVLERQHSPATLQRVKPFIEQLHASYQDVRKGDRYRLCYNAVNQTTHLSLNNQTLVTLSSPEFAQVYFGIWLGEYQPLAQTLREELLRNL